MVAVVSNPNRFVVRNSLEPKEVSRSEDLAKKTDKVTAPAFKTDPQIEAFPLKEKEKKNSYIPLICGAAVVLAVCGFLYVKAEEAEFRLKKAEEITQKATDVSTLLCNNLCTLLRDDAESNEGVSMHAKSLDAMLQCEALQGDKFCSDV
ncbi:MAG: hypothetical protein K2Y01_02920 [Rhabdochlamydiaceae bacterium]|nr:hypothetical protein [Rhabdochlamydiaceae bacterium]